jgi:hypothetical protein
MLCDCLFSFFFGHQSAFFQLALCSLPFYRTLFSLSLSLSLNSLTHSLFLVVVSPSYSAACNLNKFYIGTMLSKILLFLSRSVQHAAYIRFQFIFRRKIRNNKMKRWRNKKNTTFKNNKKNKYASRLSRSRNS